MLHASGVASPKFLGGPKKIGGGKILYFSLGHRLAKHKMTKYAKNLRSVTLWDPCLSSMLSGLRTLFDFLCAKVLPILLKNLHYFHIL